MDWITKEELRLGIVSRDSTCSRSRSNTTNQPDVVYNTGRHKRRLVELQRQHAQLEAKRREREDYLAYLREVFCSKHSKSVPATSVSSPDRRKSRVVHEMPPVKSREPPVVPDINRSVTAQISVHSQADIVTLKQVISNSRAVSILSKIPRLSVVPLTRITPQVEYKSAKPELKRLPPIDPKLLTLGPQWRSLLEEEKSIERSLNDNGHPPSTQQGMHLGTTIAEQRLLASLDRLNRLLPMQRTESPDPFEKEAPMLTTTIHKPVKLRPPSAYSAATAASSRSFSATSSRYAASQPPEGYSRKAYSRHAYPINRS